MLIGVTSFFRDRQIYDALKNKIFPGIIKKKKADEPIRIWVAGCSSGEEVYSLAMTLLDLLGDSYFKGKVQIFATDINEEMLKKARLGVYKKKSVGPIPEEWLRSYFIEAENGYRVNNALREMCTFVRHNVTKDPPFSHLDMITCRNLLIYMDQQLQKKALASFRYGLNSNGYLVLGSSESITGLCSDFAASDMKYNMYINEKTGAQPAPEFTLPKDAFGQVPGRYDADSPLNNEFDIRKEVERRHPQEVRPSRCRDQRVAGRNSVHGANREIPRPLRGQSELQPFKNAQAGTYSACPFRRQASQKAGRVRENAAGKAGK